MDDRLSVDAVLPRDWLLRAADERLERTPLLFLMALRDRTTLRERALEPERALERDGALRDETRAERDFAAVARFGLHTHTVRALRECRHILLLTMDSFVKKRQLV